MVQYVYEIYNSSGSYGTSSDGNTSLSPLISGGWDDGYTSYNISSSGDVSSAGSYRRIYYGDGGSVFSIYDNKHFYRTDIYEDGTRYRYDFVVTYNYTKGSYIGQVIAENGTYPTNGRHTDGKWYIRKVVATAPTLLTPLGGESWNGLHTISWNNARTGLKTKIELTLDNGQTWSTILEATTNNATSFDYDFTNIPDSSLAKIKITGVDGTLYTLSDQSDGVFTIQHNIAPTIPTGLSPNGIVVDRTKTQRLVWQHKDSPNDVMAKADIQWRLQGSPAWNDLTSTGSDIEYYISPNTFPNGSIEWRVRTYDQSGLISPWSDVAIFTAAEPTSAPTIVQPDSVVNEARPVIEWTGGAQSSYQLIIEDSVNLVVWDTGEIISPIKARTSGVDLVNGGTYKVKVRIKEASGLFSSFIEKTFTVSFIPPAQPIVETSTNETGVVIAFTNPVEEGMQPVVVSNDIYKLIKAGWVRIAVDASSPFVDYAAISGKEESYRVHANGENGTTSQSEVVVNTLLLESPVLASALFPEIYMVLAFMTSTALQKSRGRSLTEFAGRELPLADFRKTRIEGYSFSWISLDRNEVEDFYALIDRRETFLYRDKEGRKDYVTINTSNEVEGNAGAVFNISFNADVVWFKEEV